MKVIQLSGLSQISASDAATCVRAGDPLIDGPIGSHEVLAVLGIKELQRYLVDKIQEVYRSQSVARRPPDPGRYRHARVPRRLPREGRTASDPALAGRPAAPGDEALSLADFDDEQ